jgi:hypothetical protein
MISEAQTGQGLPQISAVHDLQRSLIDSDGNCLNLQHSSRYYSDWQKYLTMTNSFSICSDGFLFDLVPLFPCACVLFQVVLQHQEIDVTNTADALMNARKVVIVPGGCLSCLLVALNALMLMMMPVLLRFISKYLSSSQNVPFNSLP